MVFWAVVNVAISLIFVLSIKAPLMRAYLILNYVLIVNPTFMWTFFGIAHPRFIPGHGSYEIALIYMALFNLVLCCSFLVLMRLLPRSRFARRHVLAHRINTSEDTGRMVFIAVGLVALGVTGKLVLDSMGALRMLDAGGTGPFLQAVKVLAGFDLLSIVLLGELRLSAKRRQKLLNSVLASVLLISFILAVASGSRSQSVTVLLLGLLAYRDVVLHYRLVVVPVLALVIPVVFMLFPLLGHYRNHNYDLTEALYLLEKTNQDRYEIMLDVVATRLNYQETVARAVDVVQHQGPMGGAVYWNNIVGVIPRLIWEGKPSIDNDSRQIGHMLGIVTVDDTSTSIGLQVVGESFFEYGWLGLWVAVFQALIFTMIHKNLYCPGNRVGMTAYIFVSLYILQRDGYFAVVPGLIWLLIGFILFFGTFAVLMPRRRKPPSNETLPYRFSH
ncbi:MAG: hypothetical protein RIE84_07810 [Parvibaculum sp.]|uniref:hypothetical protein n=1 Tax=Parvibaculum sp. TaxID=2024848 RepID=UPI0032EFC57A